MNGPGDPNQDGYPPQGSGQGYPPPPGQAPQGGYPPPPDQTPQGGYPPHQPYPPGAPPPGRKNNTTLIIALAVLAVVAIGGVAAAYFTGLFGGGSSTAQNKTTPVGTAGTGTTTPITTPTASPTAPAAPGRTLTPEQVAQRLELGVAQFRAQLPLRNGPATITSVSSSGMVLTMDMQISQAVTPAEWDQLQGEFQRSICAGQFSMAIREGASAQVNVTDTTGASRSYTIAAC